MLRIIPLTMASLMAASALKAVDMVSASQAAIQGAQAPQPTQNSNRDTSGFGPHSRPWARNLAGPDDSLGGGPVDEDAVEADENAGSIALPTDFDEADYREATQALALIRRERSLVADREAELENARALLETVRLRAESEVERLSAVRAEVQSLIDQLKELESRDLTRLVETFDGLSPKRAAELMQEMDTELVVSILDRFQERQIAAILDKMENDKALEVINFLSERRRVAAQALNIN